MADQNTLSHESNSAVAAKKGKPMTRTKTRKIQVARVDPLEDTESDIDREALFAALTTFRRGDFSVRLPNSWKGLNAKIADSFNAIAEMNESMSDELMRISQV